jgi:hypothetical protein
MAVLPPLPRVSINPISARYEAGGKGRREPAEIAARLPMT